MIYCVNCEYVVSRDEVDARRCKNCGKDPAHESQETTPAMHTIVLNDDEVANLRVLIEACGYGFGKRVQRNPLWAANTGDWIGTLYQKLPQVECPERSAHDLAARALKFV
jgi:hypothetical protein